MMSLTLALALLMSGPTQWVMTYAGTCKVGLGNEKRACRMQLPISLEYDPTNASKPPSGNVLGKGEWKAELLIPPRGDEPSLLFQCPLPGGIEKDSCSTEKTTSKVVVRGKTRFELERRLESLELKASNNEDTVEVGVHPDYMHHALPLVLLVGVLAMLASIVSLAV